MRQRTIPTRSTITVRATVDVLTTADDHTARVDIHRAADTAAHMINTGHARTHGDGTYQPADVSLIRPNVPRRYDTDDAGRTRHAPRAGRAERYRVTVSYRLTTDTPHALDRGTQGAITYARGLAKLIFGRVTRRDHVNGAIIIDARVDVDHEEE